MAARLRRRISAAYLTGGIAVMVWIVAELDSDLHEIDISLLYNGRIIFWTRLV